MNTQTIRRKLNSNIFNKYYPVKCENEKEMVLENCQKKLKPIAKYQSSMAWAVCKQYVKKMKIEDVALANTCNSKCKCKEDMLKLLVATENVAESENKRTCKMLDEYLQKTTAVSDYFCGKCKGDNVSIDDINFLLELHNEKHHTKCSVLLTLIALALFLTAMYITATL